MSSEESTVTVELGELDELLSQHAAMKEEIRKLKESLSHSEGKWNRVIKSTLRENVALKEQNQQLRKRLKELRHDDTTASSEEAA